jgi:hypothetical protein
MRLYTYVVDHDFGFAPNPFHGICTLATCKPVIRRTARKGDWIAGSAAKHTGRYGRLVYFMRVDGDLTFDGYWNDPRFQVKKPNLKGSLMMAFGDNIYRRCDHSGGWMQENSLHSFPDGRPNPANVAHDTKADRILYGSEYAYFGRQGPEVPLEFQEAGMTSGRGHRVNFDAGLKAAFIAWLVSLDVRGLAGRPGDWPNSV